MKKWERIVPPVGEGADKWQLTFKDIFDNIDPNYLEMQTVEGGKNNLVIHNKYNRHRLISYYIYKGLLQKCSKKFIKKNEKHFREGLKEDEKQALIKLLDEKLRAPVPAESSV